MAKHVVVLASGETERLALPHLVQHLAEQGVVVDSIRIPPRHRALNADMAKRLIKVVWHEDANARPQKFVVLVDTNSSEPDDVLQPIRDELSGRMQDIAADLQFACAQPHLEAWYFADSKNLRRCIGRAPGHVDTSQPDQMANPKNHLRNLLGQRVYTARMSEDIASKLSASAILERSPSFRGFVNAVLNGGQEKEGRPG